jgi:FkbM family methyltransferase
MNNFYKDFTKEYFKEINKDLVSYKSIFRKKISRNQKIKYYYEILIDFITKKISLNRMKISLLDKSNYFLNNLYQFEDFYILLDDEYSKKQYIRYIVFRALNSSSRKLDTAIEDYSKELLKIDKLKIEGYKNYYDLSNIGFNIKLLNDPVSLMVTYVAEQYAYKNIVKVSEHDIVIDCGGATGDTALYFAAKKAKKVYIAEFIKSNISIIKNQMANNLHYKDSLSIIDHPLWSESNMILSYKDCGNASVVGEDGLYPNSVTSVTIDAMVIQNKISKVDFIKMDIEGAEVPALEGAMETIKNHKPKLAICAYHKDNDLVKIPELIKKINPNYKFYFDYYTDIGWEAVIYAIEPKHEKIN